MIVIFQTSARFWLSFLFLLYLKITDACRITAVSSGFTNCIKNCETDQRWPPLVRKKLYQESEESAFRPNFLMECDDTEKPYSQGYEKHGLDKPVFGRFIVVSKLCEQLTKSRMHLAEILTFARATKRTLVLPHCEEGHIGNSLYFKFPICLYFDISKIGNFVDWVSEKYFLKRMARHREIGAMPSIRAVYFTWLESVCNPDEIVIGKMPKFMWVTSHNLTMDDLRSEGYVCTKNCPVQESLPSPLSVAHDEVNSKADVLVVGKSTPFECIPFSDQMKFVAPSPRIVQFVSRFVERRLSRKYVAVHWRMEFSIRKRASHAQMTACAEGLVASVRKVTRENGFSGIFVATDFSPDNVSLSYTLGFSEEKRSFLLKMVKYIHEELGPSTVQEFYPAIIGTDSGVWGLADKLICSRATVFLFAPPLCFGQDRGSAPVSSYTRAILNMRRANRLSEDSGRMWDA